MNIEDAVNLFLGEQRNTTADSYRYVLQDMLRHLGPARSANDIAPHHLIEYHQVIKKRNYRMATRNKYVKTVKVLFNWMVKARIISESPAAVLKQEFDNKEVPRSKAMKDDELSSVLGYTAYVPRIDALMRFLADTGCRRGGAAGLKVSDIDMETRQAKVTEKGDKTRTVAFGESTRQALITWLLARPANAGEYVFSRHGEPVTPAAISQMVRRACKKVGVRSLGAHSLRHRKGHQFADAKIAPSIAATALGHTDPTITLRHYYPREWEKAREALEELSLPVAQPSKIITLKRAR